MKNIFAKAISALLVVCLALAAAPAAGLRGLFAFRSDASGIVDSGSCGENVTWTLDENGLLTIGGTGPMWEYYWGESPFYMNEAVKTVAIGSGVTTVGSAAFPGCSSLTSVSIPQSVAAIGDEAFFGCKSLTDVTIPEGAASIGRQAFSGCTELTSVSIPWTVTSMGELLFYGCASLSSISVAPGNPVYRSDGNCLIETEKKLITEGCSTSVIPLDGSVTGIGFGAFWGREGLTAATIPASVTFIDGNPFACCSGLTAFVVEDGNPVYHVSGNCLIETAEKRLVAGCKTSAIPLDGSVTSIGESAFEVCTGLTSLVLPVSVTFIGDRAFYGCSALTDVYYTGSEEQRENMLFRDIRGALLTADWHYNYIPPQELPKIDTDTARETETGLYVKAGSTADGLLALTGEGAVLLGPDDLQVVGERNIGSGMTLKKADGTGLTVIVKGDNDGDGGITAADARFALRIAVDLETPNAWQKEASRVAGGESVTAADARLILRAAVELEALELA